jgi:hypothetical protein
MFLVCKKHQKKIDLNKKRDRTNKKGFSMLFDLEPSDFNFCKDVWSVILQFVPTWQLAKFRVINKRFDGLVTTEMRKRCVTLDDHVSIALLLDFAYQDCIVSHATYQGKEYYPCDTFWCERPEDVPERDYDPNEVCDADMFDYDLECFVRKLGPIDKEKWLAHEKIGLSYEELKTIFPKLPKMCSLYFHPPSIVANDPEKIIYHFDVADPDAMGYPRRRLGKAVMEFRGCTLVYMPHAMWLINKVGRMNPDHRGQNHMNIVLDWQDEFVIPAGIHSVYDIVQSCFRIKGNKFENSYEMFCRIISVDYPEKRSRDIEELSKVIDFDDSEWFVTMGVAYGS